MTAIGAVQLKVVSLRAEDLPATVHFYRHVLGFNLVHHHEHHPSFELQNGVFLVIVQSQSKVEQISGEAAFPVLAFEVEDLETAIKTLESNSVALPWGVEERSGSRWVKFYDPAGNLIEIVQFL
jgi:catechol 2,3-dioxygenase-like lactoylglutathione lyase family enzyme